MKSERELFLYELEGRGFIFKNKTWIHGLGDVGGLFDDDQLNMVWEMWCASAQREGYKLVPLQPSNNTIVVIERKVENQLEASGIDADPFRLDGEKIYKAMIGAAP